MATSLVSTGVQFPDSTIQTTAASASPITLISSATSTSGTTLTFTGLTTSYRYYVFSFTNLKNDNTPTSSAGYSELYIRFSNNNGSSYATSGYLTIAPGSVGTSGGGTNRVLTGLTTNNLTGSSMNGEFTLYNPALSGPQGNYQISGTSVHLMPPGYGDPFVTVSNVAGTMSGGGFVGYSAINAVQFYWESNRSFTSGNWKLFGVS